MTDRWFDRIAFMLVLIWATIMFFGLCIAPALDSILDLLRERKSDAK